MAISVAAVTGSVTNRFTVQVISLISSLGFPMSDVASCAGKREQDAGRSWGICRGVRGAWRTARADFAQQNSPEPVSRETRFDSGLWSRSRRLERTRQQPKQSSSLVVAKLAKIRVRALSTLPRL